MLNKQAFSFPSGKSMRNTMRSSSMSEGHNFLSPDMIFPRGGDFDISPVGGGGGSGSPSQFLSPGGSPDDFIVCLYCMNSFHDPCILSCEHIFCEHCLCSYYQTFQSEQKEGHICCPTCQQLTAVPDCGLASLRFDQNDEKFNQMGRKISTCAPGMIQKCDVCICRRKFEEAEFYCNKCSLNMCTECKGLHNDNHLFTQHPVIHISTKETINLFCDAHKQSMVYFCQDCEVSNCSICIMCEHNSHNTLKLTDALLLRRDNVKTLLNKLGPPLDKIDAKLRRLSYLNSVLRTNQRNSVSLQRSTSEKTANGKTSPINVACVDIRKLSMFERPLAELTKIDIVIQDFYCQLERIKKLYDLCTKMLERSHSKRLLAVYLELISRLNTAYDVEVTYIQRRVEKMMTDKESLMHELYQCMQGTSHAGQSNGHVAHAEPSNSLSSNEDSSSLEDMVFDGPSHSLLMRPKLIWKEEKTRNDPGELWNPCDIAFLPDGSIVAAEYDIMNDKNNRLRLFTPKGRQCRIIGKGQIKPLGVTVTRDGNIAVTDCKGKRVKVFSPDGALINEWGKGMFGWPYGITCNSKGQFIVTDAFNDSVSIHQPDGKRVKQFGSSGSGKAEFRNPYHVTTDAQDNIIVSDSGNHAFKVFDSNGNYLFHNSDTPKSSAYIFDSKRKRGRKLRSPRGITTDLRGNIIVADDHSRVCMFNTDGKFLRTILTDEDGVKYPEALATTASGHLAVTEWNPNNMFAIKVFSLYE